MFAATTLKTKLGIFAVALTLGTFAVAALGTSPIGQELFADCLAGMYTRYGLNVSHKLDNSDYWEGYWTLRAIAGSDHGTPDQRAAWYQYGYSSYNINSCYTALT